MTDDNEIPEPDVPALNAWSEAHPYGDFRDTPDTRLWMPHEMPYAILQTVDRGCHQSPVLHNPERPLANLRLGGHIVIGGFLDELEQYVDAARDALRLVRWQADTIAREMAEEAKETTS